MARQKKITSEELISLINRYFVEVCNNNPKQLKIPLIGNFIRQNGYEIEDYLIRRDKAAKEYIDSLKNTAESTMLSMVSVYHTLDVEAFLAKNTTPSALKKALADRENYYHNLCSSADFCMKEYEKLKKELVQLSKKHEILLKEEVEFKEQISILQKELSDSRMKESKYKRILDTYVYPEIANELLKDEGLIVQTEGYIDESILDEQLIKEETKLENHVIKGLFNKFND